MKTRLLFLASWLFWAQLLFAQVPFTSSSLPILVIATDDSAHPPDEPKAGADLGIIWNPGGQLNHLTDPFNHFDGRINIEKRGSSSQWFPKNNFAVETANADGSSLDVPLMGFPEENDWVLHGPYSDKSLMRNALAYTLGGWTMDYAPRVRYCELVLNGEYWGVYVFTEKIKRDGDRVNVSKLTPDENSGDDLTGGYILKFDKWDGAGNDGFPSEWPPYPGSQVETVFQYHYPKPEDITPQQKAYIQGYIAQVEDALQSSGFDDPAEGYRKYFDMQAFFNYFFVQEISRNVDGYRLSTFFSKDKDSVNPKIKFGPLWDFNLGFGNADYCTGPSPEGWAIDFADFCPGDSWVPHFWWKRLWEDPAFLVEMKTRWFDLRGDTLSSARIFGAVDSLETLLQQPAARNFQRWPVLGEYVWPNAFVGGSYAAEVDYLRQWTTQRLAWLDLVMETVDVPPYDPGKWFEPRVSPNPFGGEARIDFYVKNFQEVRLEVFNAQGQLVEEVLEKKNATGENSTTCCGSLVPGIYFYRVTVGGKKAAEGKLVKVN